MPQKHVHVPRHTAGNRMDCVFYVHAFSLKGINHFAGGVLHLRQNRA